jgi:hypothetical protein
MSELEFAQPSPRTGRRSPADAWQGLRPDMPALIPGLIAIALMLVWAVFDGGYDDSVWYWGALVLLAVVAAVAWRQRGAINVPRAAAVALGAFALYVVWSYLSISWAQSKGVALDGSNRALMYLLLFTLLTILPWTPRSALIALVTFVLGVGAIAFILLFRLATGSHIGALVIEGRLSAPTGYFNANAALFTIAALVATTLAARRELSPELRGALVATASAGLQLAMTVQSRGWLFTLPLVLIIWIVLARDRLRVIAAAVLPTVALLIPIRQLLNLYNGAEIHDLGHAASRAGVVSLVVCGVVFLVATALATVDSIRKRPPMSATRSRRLGILIAVLIVAGGVAGGALATHGHPVRFIQRQWNGFSHETTSDASSSYFATLGSGRYDIWRVSLDAFAAHPIGGLGQDNFVDYYLLHRRTAEEPSYSHSFELQLLASTGIVGFVLFAVFLVAALCAARPARLRRDGIGAAVAAACILPLVVWVIHGSVDWFWPIPALSGPALGFLGVAIALSSRREGSAKASERRRPIPRWVPVIAGVAVFAASVVVLGFPYLSVREQSVAASTSATNPSGALHDLSLAADFDPLSSEPGRLAGEIALENHLYNVAESRFRQSLREEPLGWLSWLGEGLAESELGDRAAAKRDYENAYRIEKNQPAVSRALKQVDTAHPLSASQALKMLLVTP